MEPHKREQFATANHELRNFLQQADGLVDGTGTVTAEDLKSIWMRLLNLAPEVGAPSRRETIAADPRDEVAQYVKNLQTLRDALEKVRCVMLARRAQLEAAKRHIDGLQGWINAYQQTT
jgi:hypothetical protein